jgi:hypothetical protein
MTYLSIGQENDNLEPYYNRSNWKLIKNDSLTVIRNVLSNRRDTIFVCHNEGEEDDSTEAAWLGHSFNEQYRIISIVGSLLSYEYSFNMTGGAHPTGGAWYRTININTSDEVSLYYLFSGESILNALRKDSVIRKYAATTNYEDLDTLIGSLEGGCEVNFRDIFISFAITSIANDVVNIEFGLTHGCEVDYGRLTTIDIALPKSSMNYNLINK